MVYAAKLPDLMPSPPPSRESEMDVKSIPFKAPMIRALIDGRKTQHRVVLDAACDEPPAFVEGGVITAFDENDRPYRWPRTYAVGDLLWVREAWENNIGSLGDVSYRATVSADCCGAWTPKEIAEMHWKPSIHMPRWASRLTLEVTDVRVQRLQEISEADAEAEGVERDTDGWIDYLMPGTQCCLKARDSFQTLWTSINASRGFGWDANPWVVAIGFRVHPMNVDEFIAFINATAGAA